MRFTIRHRYGLSAEVFWDEVFFDPDYNTDLYREGLGFGAFSVEHEEREGDRVVARRARVRPTLNAPAPVRKLIGDALTYEERGRMDPDGRWVSEIVPSRLADKITLRTTMSTEPRGEDACDRVAEFEVRVRLLGLGKVVEKFIERTLRESYEKAAVFTNRWARERNAG